MHVIDEFSLERHEGPYESWPTRTLLLRGGQPTSARIPGYSLLRQYRLADGQVLLVVDWDCPFEEETRVLLLDSDLRLRSQVRFGAPYCTCLLDDATVVDERTLELDLGPQGRFQVSVRDSRPWLIGSLLATRRVTSS